MKRRSLFKAGMGIGLGPFLLSSKSVNQSKTPIIVSTWDFGQEANNEGWKILSEGGSSLDASEAAVRVIESDASNQTVGIGGRPDREGKVTLDACIMDGASGKCGSVAFLQDIEHPITVARMVMEKTPHAMLVGSGARKFALENGIKPINLLTKKSESEYKEWLKESKYKPVINIENHDTIGLLSLDKDGQLAGACTTSGAAYKMHGRVGDSPLIGAGLFLDKEIGAACATGLGEAVIRVSGSAMVVEAMRNGMEPEDACKMVCERILRNENGAKDLQVGFLALRKDGKVGAYSLHQGFTYAIKNEQKDIVIPASSKYTTTVE